ncbi:unnamed protein product [Caenorhabditis auriculariae]|uniref:Uncharacterized protein n=1 Tax=Caenorhabditis auriculariae TaxID=2777116 RepID=A0A8S1HY18_9PELO|nr:unnamed protein product [Caenorhabditis auriculariae]
MKNLSRCTSWCVRGIARHEVQFNEIASAASLLSSGASAGTPCACWLPLLNKMQSSRAKSRHAHAAMRLTPAFKRLLDRLQRAAPDLAGIFAAAHRRAAAASPRAFPAYSGGFSEPNRKPLRLTWEQAEPGSKLPGGQEVDRLASLKPGVKPAVAVSTSTTAGFDQKKPKEK